MHEDPEFDNRASPPARQQGISIFIPGWVAVMIAALFFAVAAPIVGFVVGGWSLAAVALGVPVMLVGGGLAARPIVMLIRGPEHPRGDHDAG